MELSKLDKIISLGMVKIDTAVERAIWNHTMPRELGFKDLGSMISGPRPYDQRLLDVKYTDMY